MAIAYPLTPPAEPPYTMASFNPTAAVAAGESPFTREQQLQVHPGELWIFTLGLPPMSRAEAQPWEATLLALNGQEGSILLGYPTRETPLGSVDGTPLVDGAGQSGRTVQTKGWTADASGVLLRGDMIGFGSDLTARMHMVVQDVNADPAGDAAIEIWPRLRYAPTDGAAVHTANVLGLFKLVNNVMPWELEGALERGLSLPVREVI